MEKAAERQLNLNNLKRLKIVMKKEKFLIGSSLFALVRNKARGLGIDPGNMKLEQLIHAVQDKEGHQSCFRKKKTCNELDCCWQRSCKAKMVTD